MNRPKGRFPGSEDPLALVQEELDGRSRSELPPRPRKSRPGEARQPSARNYDDFPPKPDNRSERTWRLVRLFVETGKEHGRTRVVSPWQLAEDLVLKISHDRQIRDFIGEHGNDLVEDLLSRMIRIYWERYVESTMSRSGIVNQYLDDYWDDLWEQAKTQYATDEITRLQTAGQLKTRPQPHWRPLANDTDYHDALQDLRVTENLQAQLMVSNEQLESETPDQQS